MTDRLRKTPSAALDDLGVPREDPDGCPFSLYGRICWLAARVRELEAAIRTHRDDYHSVGANPEALWAVLGEEPPDD
jgi:hypothetical protein